MWEPKFNMLSSHPDNMASTTSYPIARTVNLEGQDSQASTDSRRLIWRSQGLATNAPGTYIPDDSGPRYVPEIQAYSGAFFPLPSQGGAQENPFIKPGEYASALRPEPSLGRTLLASSNTGSRSQASTVPSSNDSPGSPVPSFNTGRVLVQMETPGRQAASAPEHIGIPSRVASIPPPYITPVVGDHDLHDDYKFDNLERQPSNGSTLLSRTRWNSAANGPRSACVEPSSPGGSSTWQKMSREGAKPESVRQFKASEVSKSSRLAKQKVWASDRI
ncbi:hypothetical protein BD324DRAFT_428533 [Kockovaella imperatae]|uniref:Uncharacterized protein n=1 Tax=Kockovaella imperatae TaxID=4999 RepID=A0A1Y1UJ56_9TREE|nr:hypothetical protein BD324DRAFT_428533 [Kockovaella imperatae]ORX37145.1 hypothetical protein BD324DRAFT_428533 [Kockovaella imperatae]